MKPSIEIDVTFFSLPQTPRPHFDAHVRLVTGPTRSMSLTVAARHGAAALPVFSSCARANVRGLTSKYARHPARARHVRGVTVQTRAEMEYDYDIFTIGADPGERLSTSSASVSVRAPRRTLGAASTRARRRDAPPRDDSRRSPSRFFSDKKRTFGAHAQGAFSRARLLRSRNPPAGAPISRPDRPTPPHYLRCSLPPLQAAVPAACAPLACPLRRGRRLAWLSCRTTPSRQRRRAAWAGRA